jgi:hypothetical protein
VLFSLLADSPYLLLVGEVDALFSLLSRDNLTISGKPSTVRNTYNNKIDFNYLLMAY